MTADPFVPTAHTLATASLATRAEPLVYRRSAGDRGAIPVLDAALLPDGKLLVALGEIGVWVLSREGKVAHRFAEPAHRLVVSDHGDRALALAPRGRATGLTRLARLDILGRRARPWCEMRLTTWAEDYDGSLWFTGEGSTLYAIDATRDRATSLWKVDSGSPGSRLGFIARASTNLSAVFSRSSMDGGSLRTEHEVWNFELPVLRLRARTALPEREEPVQVFAVSATGGVVGRSESSLWLGRSPGGWTLLAAAIDTVFPCAFSENWVACQIGADSNRAEIRLFDVAEARERARMELEGTELPPRVRIQGDKLVVCDRAGRVIVLSLATGAILRDFRVA